MKVEIIIAILNNLYPNGEIYITPIIYNKNNPSQPNGTIIIYFDDYLLFDENIGTIFIDFYNKQCFIIYNDITIDCSEPIIIPKLMKLKSISENYYIITIQSNDIELIGNT